jgi:small subunit ribosomal protein S17e
MGRIKTSEIKTAGRSLVSAHPNSFTTDFEGNKNALAQLNIHIESKRTRNWLAGYITRIMRIKKATA